jgi:PncC family amidohydrolase
MNTFALSKKLGVALRSKKLTLAVAESCTGGMVGAAITAIAGSSRYYTGGAIAYDNNIKKRVLGVPERILKNYGAVSAETVIAMAQGAQKLLRADCAIAVSGVAGPGGGTKEKPVGLVFIGIAVKKRVRAFEERFAGGREQVREQAVNRALELMAGALGPRDLTYSSSTPAGRSLR